MYKDFIPKALFLSSVTFLSACGTANVVGAWLNTPSSTNASSDVSHLLEHVSLANSRDILVQLPAGQSLASLQTVVPISNSHLISQDLQLYRLQIPAGRSLSQSLEALQQSGLVKTAEPNVSFRLPDFKVQATSAVQPNDPNYGLQWNMKSSKIDMAWNITTGNPNLKVAVIDSGVDPNHPDLVESLEPLEDIFNEEKGADIYRNPFSSDVNNYGGKDGNGHGTHVTGIIAATMNNTIGVTGVAGGGIKIIPIKATDSAGNTDAATLTAAFQRAIDRGADLINISIGGPASKSTAALTNVIRLALQRNIPIVSATGNESSRNSGIIAPITVPAAYSGVIAVGAHTEYDKVASYSNGGSEVDLLAPGGGGRSTTLKEGQQIWSTWPSYNTFEFYQKRVTSTFYAATSGTSMACPHVTGVVALMLAREPNLTPAQIRSRLIATADDLGAPGFDQESGYGKLNAFRALTWIQNDAQD